MGRVRTWGREPAVLEARDQALFLGTMYINIDDIRDLMRELEAKEVPTGDGSASRREVTLTTSQRTYTSVDVHEMGLHEFDRSTLACSPSGLHLTFDTDGRCRGIGALPDDVAIVRRVLGQSHIHRPISAGTRRRLAGRGATLFAMAVWLWWCLEAQPSLAGWIASGLAAAATAAVFAERARRGHDDRELGAFVRLTTTSRQEMDQRRHDDRRDWKVGALIGPAGAAIGAVGVLLVQRVAGG